MRIGYLLLLLLFSPLISTISFTSSSDPSAVNVPIGMGLAMGLAAIGAGIAVGLSGAAAMGIIAEKREAFSYALLIIALAEGIAIYGLLALFLIMSLK